MKKFIQRHIVILRHLPIQRLVRVYQRWFTKPFDSIPLSGVGAEIGVERGLHARQMLVNNRGITKLHLVDPYLGPSGGNNYLEAKARLKWFTANGRAVFQPWTVSDAVLPPLDFCYVDGSHEYGDVARDLAHIWPLIKRGGLLAGHDFHFDSPGVIRAVTEFAVVKGLTLNAESPDWWILK